MASASTQPSTLSIARLRNQYLVPDGYQAPEEVRHCCETALAATLPQALAAALERLLPENDPSLWFIRRLAVDFAVNTEVSIPGPSQVWAEEIAAALIAALQSGGPEIVRFPDYAAYLAHFLLDLVDGSAWSKWYYSRFDGLRMLPVSAAVRTAICSSPEAALKALTQISESGCGAVVRSVSASDADRILSAIIAAAESTLSSPDALAAGETECFEAIKDHWQVVLTISAFEEERRRLLLFLNVIRKNPAVAGQTLRAAVTALCRLAKLLHEESASQVNQLIRALRDRDLEALYASAGLEQAATLAPLLHCSPECFDSLLQHVTGGPVTNPETRQETRFTAFGGAFLLLPLLDQFPLHAATNSWPDLENTSPVAVIRFLILAGCFGKERALGCFRDSLLRDVMQLAPQINAEMVADWLNNLSPDNLRTFTREISAWHLETGAADGETFQLVSVVHGSSPIIVVLDKARSLWLVAADPETGTGSALQDLAALRIPQKLQCNEAWVAIARKYFPEAQLEDAAHQPDLSADLDYLALPSEFSTHLQADLMLGVATQNLLRLFSSKLTGFAHSSLNYLCCNFLECSAAVQEAENQHVVCLGRPPLHLVLAMAGLNRCSYQLSWLAGQGWAIFPEG